MNPWFIFGVRMLVAAMWLYQGFWLKMITAHPEQLAVVAAVSGLFPAALAIRLIGFVEILLGIIVATGVFHRTMALVQVGLLVGLNTIGLIFAASAISQPLGMLLRNAHFLVCVALVGLYGPGAKALKWPVQAKQ